MYYPSVTFRHGIANFNPLGIIPPQVMMLIPPVRLPMIINHIGQLINQTVAVTAKKLNTMLQEDYAREMLTMTEYSSFPRYIDVMRYALSRPWHVGVYYDATNAVQAKFIDPNYIGDVTNLVDIQKAVHKDRGTGLKGWIRLYNSWKHGHDTKGLYEKTINSRLDLMGMGKFAPFMVLVETGNEGYDAYPKNGAANLMIAYQSKYKVEMLIAFNKVQAMIPLLIGQGGLYFSVYTPETVFVENKAYHGYSWTTRSGNKIFIISGTERISGGMPAAKGFVFRQGSLIKKFFGWVPKI